MGAFVSNKIGGFHARIATAHFITHKRSEAQMSALMEGELATFSGRKSATCFHAHEGALAAVQAAVLRKSTPIFGHVKAAWLT